MPHKTKRRDGSDKFDGGDQRGTPVLRFNHVESVPATEAAITKVGRKRIIGEPVDGRISTVIGDIRPSGDSELFIASLYKSGVPTVHRQC